MLYLCYQSISEPLTQTQVVAYLEGLAQAGYALILLTFEPRALTATEAGSWRVRLRQKGIDWHWLRYHKRPTAPATAWDIFAGILTGLRLAKRYNVKLLHARAHVPGVIALVLKRLTGAKFLFDIRGFMAEEYADAGIWSENGMLFRMTKRGERTLVQAADGIVVLTGKAQDLVRQWYPAEVASKPIQVIPCCVDLRQFPVGRFNQERSGTESNCTTIAYIGKLGGWYPTREMVEFVTVTKKCIPDLQWQVWTQSDPSALKHEIGVQGLDGVAIGRVEPQDLPSKLLHANVGLSLYKRNLSAAGCSPTKVGEYLAAGLPVVSSAGIGDVDDLLRNVGKGAVGIVVKDMTPSSFDGAAATLKALLDDPQIRERCRAVAEEKLDLERVGWARYRQMYEELIGT